MSYTCRLYIGTGFNTINIPDSVTTLLSACESYIDVPVLNILQDGGALSYVDVHVSGFSQIAMVDYANVGDYYYYVDGQKTQMLSSDTARLFLSCNALLTLGGIGYFRCLDGVTRRICVNPQFDTFGLYNEADELLAPAQEMSLLTYLYQGSSNNNVVVKSTIDLYAMGVGDSDSAYTYTDPATGETVTVPQTIAATAANATKYYLGETDSVQLNGESTSTLYSTLYGDVLTGLNKANYLGVTGAITAQVAIPSSYVKLTLEDGRVTSAVGIDETQELSTMPFNVFSNVQNERINYSEYMPFGLCTASGDRMEFTPASIYDDNTAPTLRIITDPHTDGKPYFRYNSYKGNTTREYFFNNAVAGMPWKQIPLTYEGANGKYNQDLALAQSQDKAAYEIQRAVQYQGRKSAGALAGGVIGGLVQTGIGAAGLMGGDSEGLLSITAGIGNIFQSVANANEARNDLQELINQYKQERMLERRQYEAETRVYVPNVQFPYSSDLMNDLYNNPCIAYRFVYSDTDAARIDRLLTMYGYKITRALVSSDFSDRKYFNYVEADCSIEGVGTLKSRWLNDLAAAQLANGVRIWHVAPDISYYTTGNPGVDE